MPLPEHLTRFALGASNVCLVGETRRAPSRHSRDARVCDHTTTTMHKLSTPPRRPSAFFATLRVVLCLDGLCCNNFSDRSWTPPEDALTPGKVVAIVSVVLSVVYESALANAAAVGC